MRTSDMRFSSTNDNSSVRFNSNIQYIPQQHNPAQNIFYQPIQISPQIANGSHLSNYLYPSLIPMPNHQQMLMSGNQQLLISMPNANSISDNQALGSISTVESSLSSSVTSPHNITPIQNQMPINYTVNKWHEIAAFYDGNVDERPSAGQLKNGKYFTQRSAGKDIYMVFNSISDYINNFVNYYFSNKNFSTDEKLFNLMDESGSVAVKDLIKFPRLAHIGTTVDDIVEALKYNNFVKIVTIKTDLKGVRRSDGWFPTKLIDDSHQSNVSQWIPVSTETVSSYSKKSDLNNDNQGKNKIIYSPPSSVNSGSTQTIIDSNIISQSHQNDMMNSHIETSVGPNSLIYFNHPNNTIHQPMFQSHFVQGIHHNSLQNLQSQSHGAHMLAPANPPQLILHTPFNQFYPPNQSFHFRPLWQNQNITDFSGNPILYSNNANMRHVIGAGGNSVNSNLR